MPYVQKPPSVNLGLVPVKLPDGRVIEVPQAFMERIRFDLDVSNQTTAFARGEELNQSFRGAPKGQYVAYAGLDEFLNRIKNSYSGSGQAVQYSKPYQEQRQLYDLQQQQIKTLGDSGASRRINVNPTGQVTADTGQMITGQQLTSYSPAIEREDRKMRGAMMADLQQFKKIGQQSTISNLPITVTRSNDPDVRGSMAKHLEKLGQLKTTA